MDDCSNKHKGFGILVAMTVKTNKKQVAKRPRAQTARGLARDDKVFESDSTYFLKLVVFALLGTLWLKFGQSVSWMTIPINAIPLGLFIGIILIWKLESHQSDRKIWYAVLFFMTLICNFVPAGIII
jgi:hypothetical protein